MSDELPQGITLKKIDGVWYRCLDIGCPDFEAAARNREMIAHGRNIGYFLETYDPAVERMKEGKDVPEDFEYGEMFQAGKRDRSPSDEGGK